MGKPMTAAAKAARVREITTETEKIQTALDLVRRQRAAAEGDEKLALESRAYAQDELDEATDEADAQMARVEGLRQQEELFAQEIQELEEEAAELLELEPSDLDGTAVDDPIEGDEGQYCVPVGFCPGHDETGAPLSMAEIFDGGQDAIEAAHTHRPVELLDDPGAHARITNITDGFTEEFPE